jgi:tetratricopeptide (TPR) repeat protein
MALLVAAPGFAAPVSPLGAYARGRIAEISGDNAEAASAYAVALIAAPGDPMIALRAYRQAIESGDKRLAIEAAQIADAAKVAPPDAQLLLLSQMLARGDWKGASAMSDRMEREDSLAFLTPALRAWTAFGSGTGDPLALLAGRQGDALARAYARDHRILLLLALKRKDEAITALRSEIGTDDHSTPIRLAAAAQLVALNDKTAALDLLRGGDPALVAARKRVEVGKPLLGAINTAPKGVAQLFSAVARDLMRESPSEAALAFARLASFVGLPEDETRVTLARALISGGHMEAALAELDRIAPDSLLADAAIDARITALERKGRSGEAIALAEAATRTPTARTLSRLGDLHAQVGDPAAAVKAYEAALAGQPPPSAEAAARLWLRLGTAHEAAGNWAQAKAALKEATTLAPDFADALNHLGYAMIEHGEALDEATRLIARASSLRPEDPAITDSLGWAWFKRGNMAEAIHFLEVASAGDPTIAEIAEHLGDAYWVAGRKMDARYSWRAALVQADADDVQTRLRTKIADGLIALRK